MKNQTGRLQQCTPNLQNFFPEGVITGRATCEHGRDVRLRKMRPFLGQRVILDVDFASTEERVMTRIAAGEPTP